LLAEAGSDVDRALVSPDPRGIEAAADWAHLRTPETYTGYERAVGFASAGGMRPDRTHVYVAPERLGLNQWALSGGWTAQAQSSRTDAPDDRLAYRFHARDVHLVMGPAAPGTTVRYQVLLDGEPPGSAHGGDVDDRGQGFVADQRLHQLIRQPGAVTERTFEIVFLDPGVQVYAFTFG
jgi:hypothetical protein